MSDELFHLRRFALVVALATVALSSQADPLSGENGKLKVQPVVPLKVSAFPLQDVRLLDGPFKHAMELDAQVSDGT